MKNKRFDHHILSVVWNARVSISREKVFRCIVLTGILMISSMLIFGLSKVHAITCVNFSCILCGHHGLFLAFLRYFERYSFLNDISIDKILLNSILFNYIL